MKKLFLCAAIAVFGLTSVNAQDVTGGFNNGDLYVSGTVGFNSTKQGDAKTSGFDFSPTVGLFVTDNIALEANLIAGSAKDVADNSLNKLGFGLGANYFFTPASQFSFTLGAGLSYVNQTMKYDADGVNDDKHNTFAIAVAPGLNYFVTNKFALRASIGALSYTSGKADVDGADAANNFALNMDLSDINFGVTYKF